MSIGHTTFRTNSLAAMPYLQAVDLTLPIGFPGGTSATFVIRLYPGLFGLEYLESPKFVVSPLGGDSGNGAPPLPQPGLNGFQQIGCVEAAVIVPDRSLYVVGETAVLNTVPPVEMLWRGPDFRILHFAQSSLTIANIQESDAGTYFAERYCPGIPTIGPFESRFSTLVVIPRIEVQLQLKDKLPHFTFESRPGVIYALRKSETVAPDTWRDVTTFTGAHGIVQLMETNRLGPMGFYRIAARLPEEHR